MKQDLSLDELIDAVSAELHQLALDTLPDRRASLLPDVRMVRYYTSLGLLPAPAIVMRQARYNANHVADLLLIKLLQAQGQSLAQIQQQLLGMGVEQRQSWLSQLKQALAAKVSPMPATILWREVVLEPGLRLQLSDDYTCSDPEALLHRIRSLLNAQAGNK
ncbi:MAG: hypothetical protein CVV27_07915 [Candidatus Melainabacteria bacterium HGW-Melainabacteria-1]|nr:MAG: hypothetical protein CVV27_07915 [Candidatus Melainabacteria bacterium HGW-Melainabacteria-1]